MRKALTQVSDTEAAANTFRAKYNALPGDLSNASTFFAAVTPAASTANGQGDGDGLIEGVSAAATPCAAGACASGESSVFYYEAAQAGYIKDAITWFAMGTYTATVANISTGMYLQSALGKGALLVPTSSSTTNQNYLVLVGAPSAAAVAGQPTWTAAVTPLQASDIDTKLDDGNPTTGGVVSIAVATGLPATVANAGAAACYTAATTSYNATLTGQLCSLSLRVSF
jgi:hypothetical protein